MTIRQVQAEMLGPLRCDERTLQRRTDRTAGVADGSEQGYSFEAYDREGRLVDHEGLTLVRRSKVRLPGSAYWLRLE